MTMNSVRSGVSTSLQHTKLTAKQVGNPVNGSLGSSDSRAGDKQLSTCLLLVHATCCATSLDCVP